MRLDPDYVPLPHQNEMHWCRLPVVYLRGGYGSAKSYALAHEACSHALANPGLVGGMASATYPMLKSTLVRDVKGVFDRSKIPYRENKGDKFIYIPWTNSTIEYRSADNPDSMKGPNWAWGVGDEIALWSEEAWIVFDSRVRDPNALLRETRVGGTPEGGLDSWAVQLFDELRPPGHKVIQAHTRDNIYLPDEYLDRLEATYDEAHQKAYLAGEPTDLHRGSVYGSWDRATHVSAFEWGDPQEIEHDFDFNVDPACSLVTYRDRFGNFYVWDEIRIEGGADTPDVCREFIRRYGDFKGQIAVGGDAAGSARSTKAAVSDYHLIRQAYDEHFGGRFIGIRVPRANPRVQDRVNAVNAALRQGKVFVHERCRWLISDMGRTVWREGTREIDKKNAKITHLSDALGYRIVRDAPAISNTRSDPSILKAMRKGERRRVAL